MPKNKKVTEKVIYRLDFRPPATILKDGFAGTNNEWMNTVYGTSTVFCARTLRGISRFFLESALDMGAAGIDAAGRRPPGPLSSSMGSVYPTTPEQVYVYCIRAKGLEYIDVQEDLEAKTTGYPINPDSKILSYIEEKKNANGVIGFDEEYWERKLRIYLNKCALYTEELIVKGPIEPARITLYQTL
ncbi:hypothetical protein [Aliamphritea hakodatensis]|uniref:hypothetical protein n=1 Tax=Aliamphritea hakodatensis TaxID=2895352 RepID=UPI0022FD445C|nr:hypothetical protein [Aliamphritea hakodatensis]